MAKRTTKPEAHSWAGYHRKEPFATLPPMSPRAVGGGMSAY
jgi:hypothetical protein